MKIGPLCVLNVWSRWSRISDPRMSEGSRSIVNWIRAKSRSTVLRDRRHQEGLGEAWDALQQEVSPGQERDEDPLHHHLLADDHPADALLDLAQEAGRIVKLGGGRALDRRHGKG